MKVLRTLYRLIWYLIYRPAYDGWFWLDRHGRLCEYTEAGISFNLIKSTTKETFKIESTLHSCRLRRNDGTSIATVRFEDRTWMHVEFLYINIALSIAERQDASTALREFVSSLQVPVSYDALINTLRCNWFFGTEHPELIPLKPGQTLNDVF